MGNEIRRTSSKEREQTLDLSADPGEVTPSGDQLVDLERARRRLQVLYEVGRSICAETQSECVITSALDAIARNLKLGRCVLGRVEADGSSTALGARGVTLGAESAKWPLSHTAIRRVLAEGKALKAFDAVQDPELARAQSVAIHDIRSVLCVPLGPGNHRLGFIYADNTIEHAFTEDDFRLLTALSHFVYVAIKNAAELEREQLERRRSDARAEVLQAERFSSRIVGSSPKLLEEIERLRRAAQHDVPILILGESGTGKELFADAAHKASPRVKKPFVPVNVAALAEGVLESELFGHRKGAFNNAIEDREGRIELANGGTLFLDEIAEVPLHIQPKLLRVLEDQKFERIGSNTTIESKFRLVCATNKNLEALVAEGQFREDLYWRIRGVVISIPPLRDRPEDVPELIRTVLERIKSKKTFAPDALRYLQAYRWPGNVRQLVRIVEEVNATVDVDEVTVDHLPSHLARSAQADTPTGFPTLAEAVREAERVHIEKALRVTGGKNNEAIKLLGIAKATFFDRKKEFGL